MVIKNTSVNSRPLRTNVKTVNGKLIIQELSDEENTQFQIVELADHLKQLESKVLAIQDQDRTECIKHFKALKIAVHRLRHLSNRLLWATTAALVTLIILLMWINWRSQPQTKYCSSQALPISLNRSN
jgi:hypothetical protein